MKNKMKRFTARRVRGKGKHGDVSGLAIKRVHKDQIITVTRLQSDGGL